MNAIEWFFLFFFFLRISTFALKILKDPYLVRFCWHRKSIKTITNYSSSKKIKYSFETFSFTCDYSQELI